MDIQYQSRAKWRGRGRPALAIPPGIFDALEKTRLDGSVAEIPLDVDATDKEIRQVVRLLRAAGRDLGGRTHVQRDPGLIRFYLSKESDQRESDNVSA